MTLLIKNKLGTVAVTVQKFRLYTEIIYHESNRIPRWMEEMEGKIGETEEGEREKREDREEGIDEGKKEV